MNEFLPMTEDEQLMFSTTPIKGNNQILGTWFFYYHEDTGQHYLITAKHVIYDDEIQVSTFSYEIHKKPPNTAVETFTFDINAAIKHPEDEIDLAAVQFPDSIVNSTELYLLCVTSKMVKQKNELLLSRSAVIPVIM